MLNFNPFVGPRTFTEEDRDRFFGREREARDLMDLVASTQLVLFYAQSGAGKSSLINTSLIPDLKRAGFNILPVGRVSGHSSEGIEADNIYIYNLIRALVDWDKDPIRLTSLSLSDFLAGLKLDQRGYFYQDDLSVGMAHEDKEYPSKRPVLIIDQFEELFSTHQEAWQKRQDFFVQLSQAMQDHPALSVVLVLREDFVAGLDLYANLLPGGMRVRYYMQRLGYGGALKAIKSPVERVRPFAPGVAESLVNDLSSIKIIGPDGALSLIAGQFVEPVQLQVVCYSLWERLPPAGTEITEKHIGDMGDVSQALGSYYAERVKSVAEMKMIKESLIRKWFETKLIAAGGVRDLVLREPGGSSAGLEDQVIEALQSDLVRAEVRGGVVFYELTHDRLVEPILVNNKKWFEEHLSPLQRQTALWNDQHRNENWLLTDQALMEMEEWARNHNDELTELEDEFLDVSRKLRAKVAERRLAESLQLEMAQRLAAEQARSAQRARISNVIAASLLVISVIQSILIFRGASNTQNLAIILLIIVALLMGYFFGRTR